MEVTLSTGEKVFFRPHFSHKADKVLWEELGKDARILQDAEGNVTGKEVPALNYSRAYEAALPYVVERIEGGQATLCTPEWLDGLPWTDFNRLSAAAQQLHLRDVAEKEGAKKKRLSGWRAPSGA